MEEKKIEESDLLLKSMINRELRMKGLKYDFGLEILLKNLGQLG